MSLKVKTKIVTYKTLKKAVPLVDFLVSNRKVRKHVLKVLNKATIRYQNKPQELAVIRDDSFEGAWLISLDTPKGGKLEKKDVYVSGWFVPTESETTHLRLKAPDGTTTKIYYGVQRIDVAGSLSRKLKKTVSRKCGFELTVKVEQDGKYFIEFSSDLNTWEKVYAFNLSYDPDYLPKDLYNPNMAKNYAEHLNTVDSKKKYFYEKSNPKNFKLSAKDPKLIAFYLPQFHPIKENNEWWGTGFTEWSNVASAVPRFVGHEQPKLPLDLGYYDLRNEEVIYDQIKLAKKHGVYGFCFYYYWFSGKRLLERPLNSFLEHKDWDFNFMICWANENWTRRWDGRQQDVLIEQKHNDDDPINFIKDIEHILLDPRYIRVNGKPILLIYRAKDLEEPKKYIQIWRDYFKNTHKTDIHIIAVQSFDFEDPRNEGFDNGLEFVPLSIAASLDGPLPDYPISDKIIDVKFTGPVYDYRKTVNSIITSSPKYSTYRSVMPSWDNDARKKGAGGVFQNANPDLYGKWLAQVINDSVKANKEDDKSLIFINAWNEWAEGTYLEPDVQYGHAYLNRTAEVLANFSSDKNNKSNFPLYSMARTPEVKLAVVVHLYYADLWPVFMKQLSVLPAESYDLFVSLPQKNSSFLKDIKSFKNNANVIITPNRGRDVLPFVHIGRRLKEVGYEYVLKLHSKKSVHRADGEKWLSDMLKRLIPKSTQQLAELFDLLDKTDTGIIGPYGHYVSLTAYFGSNEQKIIAAMDDIVGTKQSDKVAKNIEKFGFFAGTMFWARLDALGPILDQGYQVDDFDAEYGQIDGTFAHALERLFCVIPEINKKKMYSIDEGVTREVGVTESGSDNYNFAKNE